MSDTGRAARAGCRRLVMCALSLLWLGPNLVAARQPSPQSQEPGAGAQVHTGTSSGVDANQRMQTLLASHEFLRAEGALSGLPPEQAQLYRGILANRNNDPKTSIQLLEPLVDKVTANGNVADEKLVRKALAEDYLRDGDWSKAAAAYAALDKRLHANLTEDERDEIEMPLKILPLAASAPPMTVEPSDPFVMQVSTDPLGLTDVPVFVDAMPHSWMLDPTAPFNLIARSIAREIGLKVSEQAVTIHTLTGRPMQVHITTIPRFTLAGRLTFHNMTAFVYDDQDYAFPNSGYQVQGVLGYPALSALGSVTITADATIEVRPAKLAKTGEARTGELDPNADTGARFFLDGDQMILALGPAGQERTFAVDAAGQQSYFTSRYYNEHTADFASEKMELFTLPGATTYPPQPAYVAESVPLDIGGTIARAHYIRVLTQPLGSAAIDDLYGFLGVDVLGQFRSYTFDYQKMRFRVRPA